MASTMSFKMRTAGPARSYTDPITLAPMLVRCETGDQRGLLIENPATIQYRTWKLRPQHLTARQRFDHQ